jgi:hypothetical protein
VAGVDLRGPLLLPPRQWPPLRAGAGAAACSRRMARSARLRRRPAAGAPRRLRRDRRVSRRRRRDRPEPPAPAERVLPLPVAAAQHLERGRLPLRRTLRDAAETEGTIALGGGPLAGGIRAHFADELVAQLLMAGRDEEEMRLPLGGSASYRRRTTASPRPRLAATSTASARESSPRSAPASSGPWRPPDAYLPECHLGVLSPWPWWLRLRLRRRPGAPSAVTRRPRRWFSGASC